MLSTELVCVFFDARAMRLSILCAATLSVCDPVEARVHLAQAWGCPRPRAIERTFCNISKRGKTIQFARPMTA